MGMKIDAFEHALRLFVDELAPAKISAAHAAYAVQQRDEAIARGEAPAKFRTIVDGVEGAPESSVRPGGSIVYEFDIWEPIIPYALEFARARSPKLSGRYRDAWFVMVNGAEHRGGDIPAGAEVIVTNDRPYHRKVEIGAMTMHVPPGVVQDLEQAVSDRFGRLVKTGVRFIDLAGAYRLKNDQFRRNGRHGARAGEPITYPALIMTEKV